MFFVDVHERQILQTLFQTTCISRLDGFNFCLKYSCPSSHTGNGADFLTQKGYLSFISNKYIRLFNFLMEMIGKA